MELSITLFVSAEQEANVEYFFENVILTFSIVESMKCDMVFTSMLL